MLKYIFFITGASGTGKTSLVSDLEKKYKYKNWKFLHFDSIGIPSLDEMVRQYGSVENWQKNTTYVWIKKMLTECSDKEIIIFEGQVNLEFINEGFAKNNFSDYKIVLLDCNEDIMIKRIVECREQPELLTQDMKNWLKLLRKQGENFGVDIIETSDKTKLEVLQTFEQILKEKGLI